MLQIFRLFKAIPITWLMLFVSGLMWAADNGLSQRLNIEYNQAQEILGAESLFGLWDGAWWTVFTTAFHHGHVVHLLCNTLGLWWLGRLLETRLGSWRYAVFCLSGVAVSGAAQTIWHPYVGLSGMLYAQFGLIWAWRRTDAWLQTYMRDEHIQWGLIGLFLCLALTWLHLLQIGNAAHFSGCIYGYLAGHVYFCSSRARLWKPVFLVAHVFLVPLFYFLVHPVWNGSYHWRRGDLAIDPQERRQHFERAILWDPNLDGPWVNLALLSAKEGKLQEAWTWVLRGLLHHPSYQKGIDLARELWLSFPNRLEREAARLKLREVFGEAAPAWEEMLLAEVPVDEVMPLRVDLRANRSTSPVEEEPERVEIPTPPFTLPPRALDEIRRPWKKIPAPDPDAPGSAEEGRSA